MRVCLGLVLLSVAVFGTPVHETVHYKTVDNVFLEKQHKVLTLFKHVVQPGLVEEHVEICKGVTDLVQWLQTHKPLFTKPEVVDTLVKFSHYDYLLPKGHIFSIGEEEHLEQAIAVFKVLYYAKDFETFYQTAVILHHFTNEGTFLYSVSVAVVHRPDTYGIILPPIYEVYPWHFYSTDAIQEVYKHAMVHGTENSNVVTDTHAHNAIHANYSGHHLNLHHEQSMSYYLEDVGINAFHYYCHIHYPYWMDGEEFKINHDKRGELTMNIIQALVARYHMERLSNGKGHIPILDFHVPVDVPYYPFLQYVTGEPFPERPNHVDLHDSKVNHLEDIGTKYEHSFTKVHQCEDRISEVVDSGYVITDTGKKFNIYEDKHPENVFGNLIHANADSPHHKYYCSYLAYAKHILGYSHTSDTWEHVVPSVLDHPETTLRDPAIYMVYKKLLSYHHEFQHNLKPYTKDELVFPGVTIEKVEMDRLITYFENFFSDVTNAVWTSEVQVKKNPSAQVWIIQQRLNHKPFTYKIHVNSNQDTQAVVKVFLGPKHDEYGKPINISVNRVNFVPIDSFKWHLQVGQNVIKRSSHETMFFAADKTSYPVLTKKVTEAYKGAGKFHVTGKDNYFYFPDRYMLPKGTVGGVPYQFYFVVIPYKPYQGQTEETTFFYPHPGTGGGYVDDTSTYFPLDRPIKFEEMFVHEVPNSYFYDTKVYHRTIEEAQVPQTQQPY
ncbi:allergen Cr-PI-like [Sitophilus oryzae]|uniref:Allergen Cr-PI-like n=1 Tax=Sitophilus oryzae TaxID=7048 RepID=A0A6J2YHL7_SITOR|nr:allergen Cr-PI-like [Sitophilus oryzae]